MEPMSCKFDMEKFDGKGDFVLWKYKLLGQLEILGLLSVLKDPNEPDSDDDSDSDVEEDVEAKQGRETPSAPSTEKTVEKPEIKKKETREERRLRKNKDRRVRNLFSTCLSDSILRKIMIEKTALAMWKALEKEYQHKSLPNRIHLKKQFACYKMDAEKTIEENVDVFVKLIADMQSLQLHVSEEDKAIQLLSALPPQYENLADTLQYGSGKETLTVSEVITAAHSKETELRQKGLLNKKNQQEGLYVESRGRANKKGGDKGRGRSKSRSKSKPRSKSVKPGKGCFICGDEDHWKRDCPKRKNKGKHQKEDAANLATQEDPLVLSVSETDTQDQWVLDSGCTFHITPNKHVFFDLKEYEGGEVYMGNNTHSSVKGIGNIKIQNADGTNIVLSGVRYMPEMGRNLISYGMLEKAGCTYSGKDFTVSFYKDNKRVISGTYKDGLYYLDGKVVPPEVNVAKNAQDKTSLWHSRLGHMSEAGLKILVKRGLIKEKEVTSLSFCENCVLGKSHKQSFQKGKHTTKGVLDYIHSDLWGSPSTPASLGNCKYFLTFIDDYSRKVWIYFLRSKDEVFTKFKEWKNEVENQSGKKVKYLRTDNGLEFCNKQMDTFCKEEGVTRHRTCVYTPQQNGVSERMNRTIMDKVRCMLSESGMGQAFWAEAASTAVYLINRAPNSSVEFKLPEEIWSEKEPSLEHLRRFGCVSYVHTIQGKTEPRATKGYFMGYSQGTKGFRIWVPEQGRCITSKDVVFNEEEVFKDVIEKGNEVAESSPTKKRVTFNPFLIQPGLTDQVKSVQTPEDSESSQQEGTSQRRNQEDDSESEKETEQEREEDMNLEDYVLARDRVRRQIKPPSRYDEGNYVAYALLSAGDIDLDEPQSYQEAKISKEWKKWLEGMKEEMESLEKNGTWELVEVPKDGKVIGCKWVFRRKTGTQEEEDVRFKARLVAKGFAQVEGVDYNEVFAPVVKHVSIRIMLSIVVQYDLELEQMDVKTAFLHGELEEDIYMEQPEGFKVKGQEKKVCKLKKSLYGLKQSPRQWNKKFNEFMMEQEFHRSAYDPCVYVKGKEISNQVFLLLYVDDMLLAAKDMKKVQELKNKLKERFEMKDLGKADRILGMDIRRDRGKGILQLSQEKYLEKVLKTFNMMDSKPVANPIGSQFKLRSLNQQESAQESKLMDSVPYASAVGSLMYAMIGSRPDIAYGVGLVSRFMGNPSRTHWQAVKWLMRYLKGVLNLNLTFTKRDHFDIEGFVDADFAGDLDKRRSVTGYVFQLGGNTISWKSGLQKIVTLSTTESEYVALTEAIKEGLWLSGFCKELNVLANIPKVFCDSQSAICLAKNSVHHERTKHIDVKLHFIRDVIAEGDIIVEKVHTTENTADLMTKVLPGWRIETGLSQLRVI